MKRQRKKTDEQGSLLEMVEKGEGDSIISEPQGAFIKNLEPAAGSLADKVKGFATIGESVAGRRSATQGFIANEASFTSGARIVAGGT